MELLERTSQLAEMEEAYTDASSKGGAIVVVKAEAGGGKTALVNHFASKRGGGRQFWGLCDDLLTPRPLGAIRDVAAQIVGKLKDVIASGSVVEVSESLMEELDTPPRPTLLTIEDAHWADEATLDVLQFLGRRVDRMRALIIVTYRDDEVASDHPLRATLGTIPASSIRHMNLDPLSMDAVAQLAGTRDVDELYRITRGNPFYVTEVLKSSTTGVPTTVQDMVAARVERLEPLARQCVELTSVFPGRVERWVLEGCQVSAGLDGAIQVGILLIDTNTVSFSHELVRQAVEQGLAPSRRRELNSRALQVLAKVDAHPARLAHHAAQAEDGPKVVRFATMAARQAASLSSHREAVAHYEQSLEHRDLIEQTELADLLDSHARECFLTGSHDAAIESARQAIVIHQESDDVLRLGGSLTMLANALWFLGEGEEALETAQEAVAVLEQESPSGNLAAAYAQLSELDHLLDHPDNATSLGDKAIALSREIGDTEGLVRSLAVTGYAQWLKSPSHNALLLESLELAQRSGLDELTALGYYDLAEGYFWHMDYRQSNRYLEEGLGFTETHDVVMAHNFLLALRSMLRLEQGRWAEAEADANLVMGTEGITRVVALTTRGQLQTRRGQPGSEETLAEAQALADPSRDPDYLVPIGLTRIERAWLRGRISSVIGLVSDILTLVHELDDDLWVGEAALWAHRAGHLDEPPRDAFEPYLLHISGHTEEAARAWDEIGRPYAQADALADSSEPESLYAAMELLNDLGATPRAAMVRRRLRDLGETRIPRGPQPATKASPAHLTPRQTEVLKLLAERLTYQEIADRLYVSVKTIDHHVTAVRTKLGVTTRRAAVEEGRRLGIIEDSWS
ncbi:MAG: AAA family ATPase [Acidimicrobiia bacterium]|nr:AAA family ATPase [Acidimicrobiia bacterium]